MTLSETPIDGARTGIRYRGLLVDYGGVLTTDLFDSFRAFCATEGLAPDTVRRRFREDRACRELLIGLETGQLPEEEFEPSSPPCSGSRRRT